MIEQVLLQQNNLKKNLEEILSLKKYKDLVLNSMKNCVLAINMDGKVEAINNYGFLMLGINKGVDISNTNITENEVFYKVFREALFNNEHVNNLEITCSDDENNIFEINTSDIIDSNNNKVGVLAVIRDITEVKSLHERIERADRLAVLGTVASGLAHDIKNPLSAIKTFVQLLPLKINNQDFINQFSETVPRELDRINLTVENLLELSRKPKLNFQYISIDKLLDHIIFVYSNELSQNNIQVLKHYNIDEARVRGDPEYLNRLFSNLFLNAIQAMPNGGKLTLSIKKQNSTVTVEIRDTGVGIDKENAKKIFNPYFTTKKKGSGLGLSIVHKMVEDHNACIDFQSKVGEGTSFKVRFPIDYPND
jgi:two-component system sensor histidine kinase AtoS